MVESKSNLWNIPPIGWVQIPVTSAKTTKVKQDVSMFDNAPNDVDAGSFFGKVFIWLISGICVAALLFAAISFIWWVTGWDSSMLPFLLPVVWFIACFVWNFALAWLYNIFFSKRYYNLWKMFGLIFASSLLMFVFFFLIYLILSLKGSVSPYIILWLQVIFALYINLNLIDFLSQPNYSAASLMGNTLWCTLSIIIYVLISSLATNLDDFIATIISTVIAYITTIFGAWIWDAIYYKFYEWWNNPFYLPSLNELREEQKIQEFEKSYPTLLETINNYLRKSPMVGPDLLIGHAYFLDKTINDLEEIMNDSIIPLLYEYFMDAEKKIIDCISICKKYGYDIDDSQGRVFIKKNNA